MGIPVLPENWGTLLLSPVAVNAVADGKAALRHVLQLPGGKNRAFYVHRKKGRESVLRNIPPAELTSKKIADAAARKDLLALVRQWIQEKLAFGIINAIVFSSPKAIFLFGGLAKAGEMLLKPVRKYIDENIQPVFKGTVASGVPDAMQLFWELLLQYGTKDQNS